MLLYGGITLSKPFSLLDRAAYLASDPSGYSARLLWLPVGTWLFREAVSPSSFTPLTLTIPGRGTAAPSGPAGRVSGCRVGMNPVTRAQCPFAESFVYSCCPTLVGRPTGSSGGISSFPDSQVLRGVPAYLATRFSEPPVPVGSLQAFSHLISSLFVLFVTSFIFLLIQYTAPGYLTLSKIGRLGASDAQNRHFRPQNHPEIGPKHPKCPILTVIRARARSRAGSRVLS